MLKNFLWGVILFVLNIFLLYQNYNKNFTLPIDFFIEVNQVIALVAGVIYSSQTRRFNIKHILGVASNALVFSVLISILFMVFEAPVNITFTLLLFAAIFICMFVSYALHYWLFCPDKYKRKYAVKRKSI